MQRKLNCQNIDIMRIDSVRPIGRTQIKHRAALRGQPREPPLCCRNEEALRADYVMPLPTAIYYFDFVTKLEQRGNRPLADYFASHTHRPLISGQNVPPPVINS